MRKNFVGIQIGLVSFLDEGVPEVLDILQEKALVNALLISTLSWSYGNAGRATGAFPDHGLREPDHLIGGAMYEPDQRYYRTTFLNDFKAPDPLYKDQDFFKTITPEAKKRNLKIYPYFCEMGGPQPFQRFIPNFVHVLEIDHRWRKGPRPCINNPAYRQWKLSVHEDYIRNHDVDGIVWGIERRGPLVNMLFDDAASCFCTYCREEASRRNIDAERARFGFQQLEEFLSAAKRGDELPDGAFVEFLRVLYRYPEIMQWEKLWTDSHQSFYHELYGAAKWLNPKIDVGMHIWQKLNTFDLLNRAEYDNQQFCSCADWLKPVLYHDAAGPRFHEILAKLHRTILRDTTLDKFLPVFLDMIGLKEAPYDELPATGFSADYIFRETVRTVKGVGGRVGVRPGINVGVFIGGPELRQITPQSVAEAVEASYRGGADGIVISRNYSEATLANLAAVGDAMKQLGIGETIPDGIVDESVRSLVDGRPAEPTKKRTDTGF